MIGGRGKSAIERGACNVVSGRDEKSEKERERRRASRVAGSSSGSELRPKRSASVPFSSFFSYLRTCRRGRRFVERFVRSVLHVFRFRASLLIPRSFFLHFPLSLALSASLSLSRSICPRSRTRRSSPSLAPPVLRFLPLHPPSCLFGLSYVSRGERGALTLRVVVVPGAWCWCWWWCWLFQCRRWCTVVDGDR